jgi:hypothetical protein
VLIPEFGRRRVEDVKLKLTISTFSREKTLLGLKGTGLDDYNTAACHHSDMPESTLSCLKKYILDFDRRVENPKCTQLEVRRYHSGTT